MKKNYDQHKDSNNQAGEDKKKPVAETTENRDSVISVLKKLLGTDKEHDIHGLSQFAWP